MFQIYIRLPNFSHFCYQRWQIRIITLVKNKPKMMHRKELPFRKEYFILFTYILSQEHHYYIFVYRFEQCLYFSRVSDEGIYRLQKL